jgi:NAD(P)-dependent dehydrogenase (short-subunit alcohol dehydrogenase family)
MGLTETLARELGPDNIRVNAILPGWINNDRNRRVVQMKAQELGITPEAYVREGLQFVSMRTMIEMSEVAQMAVFLSSTAARHVSGQAIGVCGNVEYER